MSRLRACWATVDRAAPSTDLHQDAAEVGDALQGQAGHVGRAGEAVEGAVEVGAGVGLKGTETRDSGFMQPVRTQDEPAQDVAPSHASRSAGRSGRIRRRVRRPEVEPTVRAARVVVNHVLAKHSLEVAATKHERPVQALAPDGPHPTLGEGVRLRGSERGEHHADAVSGEGGVEALRVLGVAIADQEPERPTPGQVEGEVPGLLGHPRRIGTPGRSGHVDASGVDLDDEEHV
jgi:hypothetical protein